MSDEFKTNIQNWVSIDNSIKNISQQTKKLRPERNHYTNSIFTYTY